MDFIKKKKKKLFLQKKKKFILTKNFNFFKITQNSEHSPWIFSLRHFPDFDLTQVSVNT